VDAVTDPTPHNPSDAPDDAAPTAIDAAESDAAGDPGSPDSGSAGSPEAPGSGTADGVGPTVGQEAAEGVVPEPGSHPVLRYTLARLGILVAVIAVLWLLGLRHPLLLLAFGFLISGVIAMVALDRSREGAAYGITSAIRRANARLDASARAEDEPVAAPTPPEPTPDAPTPDAATRSGDAGRAGAPSAPAPPTQPLDDWDDPAPR
jgi:hypothetical protein